MTVSPTARPRTTGRASRTTPPTCSGSSSSTSTGIFDQRVQCDGGEKVAQPAGLPSQPASQAAAKVPLQSRLPPQHLQELSWEQCDLNRCGEQLTRWQNSNQPCSCRHKNYKKKLGVRWQSS